MRQSISPSPTGLSIDDFAEGKPLAQTVEAALKKGVSVEIFLRDAEQRWEGSNLKAIVSKYPTASKNFMLWDAPVGDDRWFTYSDPDNKILYTELSHRGQTAFGVGVTSQPSQEALKMTEEYRNMLRKHGKKIYPQNKSEK